ncbi:SAP domain-containing protein [Streptomyces spinosirectus]
MSVQELRDECTRRELATARSKAEMIQRLTDDDAAKEQQPETEDEGAAAQSEDDATALESEDDDGSAAPPADATPPAEATPAADEQPAAALPPGVFRMDFPAEPDGPDEETHLANRQTVLAAAAGEGLTTRGDARLVSTRDDRWTYEVLVRREH